MGGGAVGGRGNNKSRQCVIDILIRQRERAKVSVLKISHFPREFISFSKMYTSIPLVFFKIN